MNKNTKSVRWLAATVASLILVTVGTASFMTGCGDEQSASQAAKNEQITASEKVGESTAVTAASTAKDKKTNTVSGEEIPEKTEDQGSKSDSNESSRTNDSDNQNSIEKPESEISKSNSPESSRSNGNGSQNSRGNSGGSGNSGGANSSTVLTLDSHSFKVGDQVSCMISLTSTENFENYQAEIKYDSKCLKLVSAKLQGPASGGGVLNSELEGIIPFNGVDLSGYDYSNGGNFVEVVYEVIAPGTASTNVDWQIITGLSGRDYVVNGKMVGGFKYSKVYKKL